MLRAILHADKPITQREWKSAKRKDNWKNPIKEGQKYLDYLNSNPEYKYRNVTEKFGVSKPRVSQMIALIKKLPQEILNFFCMENNSDKMTHFTERRLRPLTFLDSDEMKVEKFLHMLKINLNL